MNHSSVTAPHQIIPELSDDQKSRFLFGPLPRDRAIQPENYDRKLAFWQSAVKRCALAGLTHKESVLKVSSGIEGSSIFANSNGSVPLCWQSLFQIWEKDGFIVRQSKYGSGTGGNNYSIMNLIKWPISLVGGILDMAGLGLGFGSNSNPNYEQGSSSGEWFIILDIVKEMESILLKTPIPDGIFDRCLTLDNLQKSWIPKVLAENGYPQLSSSDAAIIAQYMIRQGSIVVLEDGITALKPGVKSVSVPTETIRNVLHIKSTLQLLHDQSSSLCQRIQSLKKSVKESISKGMKSKGLLDLKLTKSLESLLEQRYKAVENLELVLLKIESAETDSEILKAYDKSAQTIENLLKDYGITPERVHETMDHLEDVIADQKDIDSAMARSINTDFDEEELENELSLLVTAQELDRATSPKSVSDTKSPVTLKEDEEAVTISDEDLLSRLEALKLAKPKPSPQLPVPEEKEDEAAVPELAM